MTKHLSIAAALVLAVACKTEAPAPANQAPAGEDTAAKARSAKIDVKPVQPALPAEPAAAPAAGDDKPAAADPPRRSPAARDEWRKRRDGKLDANGDGVVSDEERAAAMQQRVTSMRTRLDADGDGKLTPAELANAPGRMHFDNPAALDTNHDGDISADELAAGLKARRDQRRGDRAGTDQGTADPSKP
jgi:type IV secretory pathway VirB10-like protein